MTLWERDCCDSIYPDGGCLCGGRCPDCNPEPTRKQTPVPEDCDDCPGCPDCLEVVPLEDLDR